MLYRHFIAITAKGFYILSRLKSQLANKQSGPDTVSKRRQDCDIDRKKTWLEKCELLNMIYTTYKLLWYLFNFVFEKIIKDWKSDIYDIYYYLKKRLYLYDSTLVYKVFYRVFKAIKFERKL